MTFQEPMKQVPVNAQGAFQKTSTPYLRVIDGGKNNIKSNTPDQWTKEVIDSIISDTKTTQSMVAKDIEEKVRLKNIFDDVMEEPKLLRMTDFSTAETCAYKIITAEKPLIFISEDMAQSMGNMSTYLFKTIPNVPIVFENKEAEKKFKTAPLCDISRTKNLNLGYLTSTISERVTEAPDPDVLICFGKPSPKARKTFTGSDFVIRKKGDIKSPVNLSQIESFRKKFNKSDLTL